MVQFLDLLSEAEPQQNLQVKETKADYITSFTSILYDGHTQRKMFKCDAVPLPNFLLRMYFQN